MKINISCFECFLLSNTNWAVELYCKLGPSKVHSLLHSFEVSDYHLFVIRSANNRKKLRVSQLNALLKDGTKMSLMQVTLKAGAVLKESSLTGFQVRRPITPSTTLPNII